MHVRVELLLCTGWLSPLFEFMQQWFQKFAEIEVLYTILYVRMLKDYD